ncbi:acid protease [Apiospora marii]|uniref:Acid protease n=1 Tax=Apiospora marii TaxID=335849 RepID=A0ABR1RCZ1_9PEZI
MVSLVLLGPLLAAGITAVAAQTTAPPTTEPTTAAPSTTRAPGVSVVTITVQALTTTFTPPGTCTENRLTMLAPSAGYYVWLNEPVPVPGAMVGDCYPTEFMQGYVSEVGASSSIAPMFKPLVCPVGWHTAQTWANGYIACCNEGYELTPPTVTVDKERPAYGGTCYSTMTVGQTVPVSKFGNDSFTAMGNFVATKAEDHVFGHVMDGYKVGAVPGENDQKTGLNGGAIAGIVIGVVLGLCAIGLAAFFLFRRRRQQQANKNTPNDNGAPAELTPGTATSEQAYWPKESAASPSISEAPPNARPTELHSPAYAHELDNTHYQELPGNWQGHEMAGNRQY